jgi:hypothetical protein
MNAFQVMPKDRKIKKTPETFLKYYRFGDRQGDATEEREN